MAKASRSNKKQPDFDPSEIEDLIFSPAVGKGVGSHLVSSPDVNRVDMSRLATIDPLDLTTIVTSHSSPLESTQEHRIPSPDLTTVVMPSIDVTTVAVPHPTTVSVRTELWISEHGDLVSVARVKRIRLAQDVINSAEESVYDTLWNARLVAADESSRLVQAGYDYLVKRTRLSRKTIQRIVAKLLEKDFIEVDTRADIYQRTATVYRVFSYKAVLERNTRKGRHHVAKMGPGFSYVRPILANEIPAAPSHLSTVDTTNPGPIASDHMPTVDKPATVTVVKNDRPTVVKMSPPLLDTRTLDNTSSDTEQLHTTLMAYGTVDDDVVSQLVAACRSYAPDCTENEIAYFVQEKGKHVQRRDSRVHNPLGFLLTAVPKCFSGRSLDEHRAARSRELARTAETAGDEVSQEDPALKRWRKDQEAALSDPSVSEQEKHLIRLCLGLNTRQ